MKKAVSNSPKSPASFNVAIVCAQFNPQVTDVMFNAAKVYCMNSRMNVVGSVRVPGSFEVPLAVKRFLKKRNVDGVIALGAIIKGSTDHDQTIGFAITHELLRLALEFEKPVGLGVSGPGQNEEQARERADDYARRAVEAVRAQLDNA